MRTQFLLILFLACSLYAAAQTDTTIKVPFDGMDFTWQNGSYRRDSAILQSKYFNGNIMVDANATYSFWNPNDHTVVGSTALARDNEMEVSSVAIGGDFNYEAARGRVM